MTTLKYGLFAILIAAAIYGAIVYFGIDVGQLLDSALAFLSEIGSL